MVVLHKACNGNFLFTLATHPLECRVPDLSAVLEKHDIQQRRLLPVSAAYGMRASLKPAGFVLLPSVFGRRVVGCVAGP